MNKYAYKSNDSTNDTDTNTNDGPTITSTYIGRPDEEIEKEKKDELMKRITALSKKIQKEEEEEKKKRRKKEKKKKNKKN